MTNKEIRRELFDLETAPGELLWHFEADALKARLVLALLNGDVFPQTAQDDAELLLEDLIVTLLVHSQELKAFGGNLAHLRCKIPKE